MAVAKGIGEVGVIYLDEMDERWRWNVQAVRREELVTRNLGLILQSLE